jgi:hypothetical protein
MSYTDFSLAGFFSRLFLGVERAPRRERAVEAMRKRRIVHGATLIRFLLFRKRLSSGRFLSDASIQKQLALMKRLRGL